MQTSLMNKVIVSIAVEKDLPMIYRMIEGYSGNQPIDRVKVMQAARDLVSIHGVLVADVNAEPIGIMAGYVMNSLFTDDVMFSTMFFYVKPEYRRYAREFMKEVELVLLPTKVNKIVIGIPYFVHPTFKRFLHMMGYSELEAHYQKRI